MTTPLKQCRGGRVHDDALAFVSYLVSHGGTVAKSNEAIGFDLGFVVNRGGGLRQMDRPRFMQARNHVKDRVDGTAPCCAFRLHYRTTIKGSEYALIDPTGSLGSHLIVAIESLRGWAVREAQHHTENERQIEVFERLGDHALSRGDKDGYRLCSRASVEIERDGFVSNRTMAELRVWLDTITP